MSLPLLILVCACVVQHINGWQNNLDQLLDYQCPNKNQFINHVISQHHNHEEDRQFDFTCSDVVSGYDDSTTTCTYSGYVNSFDQPVHFRCPDDGFIHGMRSEHNNHHEDRIWGFYCCKIPEIHMISCEHTGWTNDLDGDQSYYVPAEHVMVGVTSEHDNHHEDRRFAYEVCRILHGGEIIVG
ncbi:hemagglutinin/amebocyte aggregation factor-like [Dreissena polymorpha]|uniref:Uncharacterized protein n=1 Tax=Dreissena polymorpha TaxID=45954 RepID=A0A9D4HDU1_DREPO|nr:hemagglutinin/amebocyte aggregation factor-like [Dreissena polymorpha]XP_052248348.1 hemagglutinin/amebocyte aggregation factor-like [Dreissena polymorpha]KAH3715850.1 hypothetical protein DPMN_058564 [Dreissena polymorpha]KAH3716209.1 hypothetical protein DPMN_058928 [Dreissena polymorpha]